MSRTPLLFLVVFASAAARIGAQSFGNGVAGALCGDTGLGYTSSLLASVVGYGTMYDVSSGTSRTVAIQGNQIIYNVPSSPGCLGGSCTILYKSIECIYSVGINYSTSSVVIVTGPPGAAGVAASQRCWNLATFSGYTGIYFNRGAVGAACPASPSSASAGHTGALGTDSYGFSSALPPGYGAACDNSSGSVINGTASGVGFWLQPNQLSVSPRAQPAGGGWTGDDGSYALSICLVGGPASAHVDANGVALMGTANGGCVAVSVSAAASAVQYSNATSGACPTLWPTSAAWNTQFVVLAPASSSSGSSAGAAPTAAPQPTALQAVSVVAYSLALAGVTNPLALVNPCTAVPLRAAAAAALGNGATLATVTLVSVAVGGTMLPIPPSALANTLTAPPTSCSGGGSGSRLLLLQQSADRSLQPMGGAMVGVQAQVPASASAAGFAAAVAGSGAPAVAGIAGLTTAGAPTGAGLTSALVAVAVPYPPRASPYVVDPLITLFHAIPRVCVGGCPGGPPGNAFSLSLTYIQGAVGVSAGLFALAAVTLLAFSIAYCSGLCACKACRGEGCCCTCRSLRDPRALRSWLGVRSWYLLLGLVNVALILSILGYLARVPTGLQQVSTGINQFAATVTLAGNYMGGGGSTVAVGTDVNASSTDGAARATALQAACTAATHGCPAAANSIITALVSGEGAAASVGASVGSMLQTVGSLLTTAGSTVNVGQIQGYITAGGNGVLGALAAFILAYSALLCRSRLACCGHGVASLFTILLSTLVCILAGAFWTVGIIGADVCFDPYSTLLTLTSNAGASGPAADTLTYYLTCGANPFEAVIGAPALLTSANATIQAALAQTQSLAAQAQAGGAGGLLAPLLSAGTPAGAALTGLVADMGNEATAISAVGVLMGCSSIDPILSTLFTGLCTNGIATIIGIARILVAASVLLFVQLAVGVDICCFHPGMPSRYRPEEGGGGGKVGPVVGAAAMHPSVVVVGSVPGYGDDPTAFSVNRPVANKSQPGMQMANSGKQSPRDPM